MFISILLWCTWKTVTQGDAMPSMVLTSSGGEHLHKYLLLILLFRPDPWIGSASISGYKMSIVSWIKYHLINFVHFVQTSFLHEIFNLFSSLFGLERASFAVLEVIKLEPDVNAKLTVNRKQLWMTYLHS